MKILEIEVEKIHPNPWNVNRMSRAMQTKLIRYLKREGLVEPLVVRPHPNQDDDYELLGGAHRYRICKEDLGHKTIPCVIVNGLDDKRAKILSVNLNSMTGETVPSLLSKLLTDLHVEMPLEDMQVLLPYDQSEIRDSLALMQLPDDLENDLEIEAAEQDSEAPTVVTLVFDKIQFEVFEKALNTAKEEVGAAKDLKARAVVLMAEAYLGAWRRTGNGSGSLEA